MTGSGSTDMHDLLLAIALVALAPVAAVQDAAAAVVAEMKAAQRCDSHQEPRRCATADGDEAFECRVKSPLAGLLHWLERDKIGDDVIVVVRARGAGVDAPASAQKRIPHRDVERIVVVHENNEPLPQCQNSNLGEHS